MEKKIKKSMFSELVQKRSLDDRRFTTLNASRWSFGYQVLRANIGKMVILNIFMVLFAIPLIYLYLQRGIWISNDVAISPFSANLGTGFMPFTKSVGLESSIVLSANLTFFKFFPLVFTLFGVALAGGLYVMRNMLWLEEVNIFKDFFKGIAKNWLVIVLALVFSAIVSVCAISISYSDCNCALGTISSGMNVFTKVICYIAMACFALIFLNASVMTVTYKVSIGGLIKNSFLVSFMFVLIPLHVFILAIALVPFILFALGGVLRYVALALIVVLGFSYAILVWTDYSHWIYEKFLSSSEKKPETNSKNASKQTATKQIEEVEEVKEELSPSEILPIKPFGDDDAEVRALPLMFTLKDIAEVEESKNNMIKASDEFANEIIAKREAENNAKTSSKPTGKNKSKK